MKTIRFSIITLIMAIVFSLESCGPVIISSRPSQPPPPWFYPNRVVNVRYIYFPDFMIYYDLSLRSYLYLDNAVWITTTILPPRYRTVDLRKARQVRVNNYFGDNIKEYHPKNTYVKGRRTSTTSTTGSRRN